MDKSKRTFSLSLAFNILTILGILFLLSLHFYKSDKIAYVDSAKLLRKFKGAVTARNSYEAKVKTWQSRIDTLTGEVKEAIKKYEIDLAKMPLKEQQLSKQLISTKQQQLSDYQRAVQENARQEDEKLTQGIISQINAFLLKYGKSNRYEIILIANQSGTIAYAREGLDITEDVVKELNEEYGTN